MNILGSRVNPLRNEQANSAKKPRRLPLRAGILFCLVLVATGCTIVPPASIQYLESLPKGALQQAKPQNVRVAVNLPQGVRITNLVADVTGEAKNDKVMASLPFEVVPKSDALSVTPADSSGQWTYYALTQTGISGFEKIQAFASRHPMGSEPVTITVKIHNKLSLENCKRKGEVPLKAAILLDPERGYVGVWNEKVSLSDLASPENWVCTPGS
ncbi:MAG: hypothetical protein ACRETC_10660 [Gammaproteobacteria bacterium]